MALAIDASTPAYVNAGAGTQASLTTASFTPPLNAILAVCYANAGSNGNGNITSLTNTGGAVTWAAAYKVHLTGNGTTAGIWLGQVTTSASMTVTANTPNQTDWGVGVAVITGALALASQTGATQTATSASGTPSGTITSLSGSNSLVIGSISNFTSGTVGTAGSNQSLTFGSHALSFSDMGTGSSGWAQYDTRMNLASGSSDTINDSAPTSITYSLAMCEILAASGGAPATPNPQPVNWPQAMWRSAYR